MTSVLIAVTGGSIAHTLRPLPLALRLRQLGARVTFAGEGPYLKFVSAKDFPIVPLPMLDYSRVLKMMDSERFHLRGLREYQSAVAKQRAVLETILPDVVVQDGPDHSLPVAAFEAGIEHVNIENATVLGLAGEQRVLPFRPWIRNRFARSDAWSAKMNSLLVLQRNIRVNFPMYVYLAQRGIPPDRIPQSSLIPDLPELFQARTDLPRKIFIGPLLYDPDPPRPEWWNQLDSSRPLIYVGVGSSGGTKGIRVMMDSLANTEYQVVLSTSDGFDATDLPENFFAARMVPLAGVLQRASAMVFHGGTSTTYMGIKYAVPMVTIPAHFDHELNARAISSRGLGATIYHHELNPAKLRNALKQVATSQDILRNLKRFQYFLAMRQPADHAAQLVLELGNHGSRTRKQEIAHNRVESDQRQDITLLRKIISIQMKHRVLMIGCGSGELAHKLVDRVGCEILCTEQHPALLRRARARGLWVKDVAIGDLQQEDSDFDFVLVFHPVDAATISAVRTRLAVNGRIVVKSKESKEKEMRMIGFSEVREIREGGEFWCVGTARVDAGGL